MILKGVIIVRYRFLRFPNGLAKAVTLSYDDGCAEDVRFVETITKYGLKCTFNFNSIALRSKNLPDELVKELILDKGHEVAVHGALHRANGLISCQDGIKDVLDCRLELESRFGRIIRGMAYPDTGITKFHNGTTYEMVKSYLTELGIAYARTLGGDNNGFYLPSDWHAWMPSCRHANPDTLKYIDEFLKINLEPWVYSAVRQPRLFYMWGHSYEFERENNWELLDQICKKLSGRDDIWYATNIEIYDYVEAYNSLQFSADGSLCHNPTALTVWFDVDGITYSVKSGETVKI